MFYLSKLEDLNAKIKGVGEKYTMDELELKLEVLGKLPKVSNDNPNEKWGGFQGVYLEKNKLADTSWSAFKQPIKLPWEAERTLHAYEIKEVPLRMVGMKSGCMSASNVLEINASHLRRPLASRIAHHRPHPAPHRPTTTHRLRLETRLQSSTLAPVMPVPSAASLRIHLRLLLLLRCCCPLSLSGSCSGFSYDGSCCGGGCTEWCHAASGHHSGTARGNPPPAARGLPAVAAVS